MLRLRMVDDYIWIKRWVLRKKSEPNDIWRHCQTNYTLFLMKQLMQLVQQLNLKFSFDAVLFILHFYWHCLKGENGAVVDDGDVF